MNRDRPTNTMYYCGHPSSRRVIIITILLGSVIIAIGLGVGLHTGLGSDCPAEASADAQDKTFKSASASYRYAAVATGTEICSQIGNDVLARHHGNAIDATVAALLCVGVALPHSAGIGGGSFYTVYHRKTDKFYSVNSRETAPGAATRDMYVADMDKSTIGGQAVGVPGEVLGLYELYRRLGSGVVTWKALVQPTVSLCEDGVPLSIPTRKALSRVEGTTNPVVSPFYDANNNALPVGTKIKFPLLARTFRHIANDPYSFYNGSLADEVVHDIQEEGGIITSQDLANYKLDWSEPTKMTIEGGYTVYSTPPPGSGAVLSYALGILSGFHLTPADIADTDSKILTYHRIAEAFKWAFGKRSALGDRHTEKVSNMTSREYCDATRGKIDDATTHGTQYYEPSFDFVADAGTAQLSVVDGEGNAVSATSTINHYFGAKFRGRRTGIVFNNEMDDFSTPNTTNYFGLPASPANFIAPGKRPMSSMCPAVVYDNTKKRVTLVSGAAGGSKITTATALNIIDVLWLGLSTSESVDQPRLHHQLLPKKLEVEKGFDEKISAGLRAKGHEVTLMRSSSVVQAVHVTDQDVVAVCDYRKKGKPDGF